MYGRRESPQSPIGSKESLAKEIEDIKRNKHEEEHTDSWIPDEKILELLQDKLENALSFFVLQLIWPKTFKALLDDFSGQTGFQRCLVVLQHLQEPRKPRSRASTDS